MALRYSNLTQVRTPNLADNSVTSPKVVDGTLTRADLSSALLSELDDKVSKNLVEKVVTSLDDLPDPIGSTIQLEDNTSYRFQGLVTGDKTIVAGISNTIFGFDKSNDGYNYTGTGNAFEVRDQTLSLVNLFLLGNGGAGSQIIDVINSPVYSFQIRECILAGDTQAGTVNGGNIIAINNNIHAANLTYGWDTKGTINKCGIDTNYFENPSATEHIHLETGSFNTIKISNNDFTINSPNAAILVDPDVVINNNGGGYINNNTFTGTGDLLSGVDAATLQWIIEDNDRGTQSTSSLLTERKVRSEAELDLYLALPDPTIYSYRIDAREFLITKPIVVPGSGVNGGLTFFGNGNNFSGTAWHGGSNPLADCLSFINQLNFMAKKVYFKVYMDRENMNYSYFVETYEGILEASKQSLIDIEEGSAELPIAIEPVFMTEEEYNSLEEFKGF